MPWQGLQAQLEQEQIGQMDDGFSPGVSRADSPEMETAQAKNTSRRKPFYDGSSGGYMTLGEVFQIGDGEPGRVEYKAALLAWQQAKEPV